MSTISKETTGRKKHRRLKKPVRRVLTAVIAGLILLLSACIIKNLFFSPEKHFQGSARIDNFIDQNRLHLKYARANGIPPLLSGKVLQRQIPELVRKGRLVKVNDTEYYVINGLSHSHPYLVPKAAGLLDMIGRRFQKKLKENGMEEYMFRVTSLLRTNESQKRLSHTNRNASANSAHLYGTTFDITYKSLVKKTIFGKYRVVYDVDAIHLLSATVGELRKEIKLVAVTEKKEACFHITVR